MLNEKINQVLAAKKPFIRDPMVFASLGLSLLLNLAHFAVLLLNIKPSSNQILLQYNVIYGPRLVEKSLFIYGIPMLALLILAANAWLAASFYRKEKLAAYFLTFSTIALQVIFFAATAALIIANE